VKILTVVGARPQFIKAGTVSRAIMEHNRSWVDGFSFLDREEQKQLETKNKELITEVIVHTGQHYDANMSDIFFEEMKIPRPDYFLGIGGKSHGAMTGQMMEKIEEVLQKEKPDRVLVYGDTDSTLAGALAAVKMHIPVAHVEAGLRSFNMKMPEEINRILTDRVSDLLFCPTDTAVENLKREGFENFGCRIVKSGDVMYDGALFYRQYAKLPGFFATKNRKPKTENYILCTIHRAENTDDPKRLRAIFEALDEIAEETPIVLPLHPRTKQRLDTINYKPKTKNFHFIDPVGYLEMVWLLDHCAMVMTDSGGLQKEAFFFQKPCITLRDETEWVELVEHRFNVLAGSDKEKIVELSQHFTFNQDYSLPLYGAGDAARKILDQMIQSFN
jgi:UDP-GlcNAc3NAcA epimerase